jgi:hypothetical protein
LSDDISDKLTFKRIFRFWVPLSATWLMMSVEGPFLSAIIARMLNPEFNLAAYGVAFSFAMIIEAPVILLMTASTALVKDLQAFRKLRNFTYALNTIATGLMFLLVVPSIFYFITIDLVKLPVEVAKLTHTALIILIPWPGAIGYRRFYQGILIRNNLTKRVAYGTVVRLSCMSLTALSLHFFTNVEGVVVGAGALAAGVTGEAIASKVMALGVLKKIKSGEIRTAESSNLTYRGIFKFYYPLALTSMITLGVQPMVTFFMGQSRMSLESLAVLPVISSFVFIFRSVGLSFQEVGIALMGKNKEGYVPLRNFAFMLGLIVISVLGIIAFTPLSNVWFYDVSGLSIQLTDFAKLPLIIMVIMPGLSVLLSFQTAVLVESHHTKPITFSTLMEFSGIILTMFISIKYFDLVGVVAATLGFIIGRIGANLYLFPPYFKALSDRPPISKKE